MNQVTVQRGMKVGTRCTLNKGVVASKETTRHKTQSAKSSCPFHYLQDKEIFENRTESFADKSFIYNPVPLGSTKYVE